MEPKPTFWTVAEVADILRVSGMTIYRMVASGELPAIRVGRSYRIPSSALDQWIDTESKREAGGAAG
ncbi:MAG: helix-turn-helix domain-containing protein [Bifidobacteriaceae bacterium]|jgi:excisionase family DNA binding protein|nr:helix-turn-helix domain-containing protein [Bifidobacteriaceae bacterium]